MSAVYLTLPSGCSLDMTDDQILACLIEKLASVTDIPAAEISGSTRLYHDAQLSGDDYRDFVVWFSHQFLVNLKGFNLSEFAPKESTNLFWPFERSKYRELNLGDLLELTRYSTLAESGLSPRWPVT
jgi:hypothetical protein